LSKEQRTVAKSNGLRRTPRGLNHNKTDAPVKELIRRDEYRYMNAGIIKKCLLASLRTGLTVAHQNVCRQTAGDRGGI